MALETEAKDDVRFS